MGYERVFFVSEGMRGNLISMKEVVLAIAKVAFYLYAFLWTIKPKNCKFDVGCARALLS